MKKIGLSLLFAVVTLLGSVVFANSSASLTATATSVNDLPANCTAAKDQCNNSCSKINGNWACTLMACDAKPSARCTQVTVDVRVTIEPKVCTMEYAPVCAKVQIQCIKAPCNPIRETFPNQCVALNNSLVSEIKTGACENTGMILVGGDRDEHGCIGSAGYSWDANSKQCIRPREAQEILEIQSAYDFAYEHGITSMDTLVGFRPDDSISRQEAAKMFVKFAQARLSVDVLNGLLNTNASCSFSDKAQFGTTLSVFVNQACQYGFIKGDMQNGKSIFFPQGNLTKAQALAVLIRIVDKRADETMSPRRQGYADKAISLGLQLGSINEFDSPISRAQLVVWMEALAEAK